MNAKNYLTFVKCLDIMIAQESVNPSKIKHFGNSGESFYGNITKGITKSRIFEIDEDIKKLLALTDPPNKNDDVNLPFPYVFLDISFTKEELKELGIKIKAKQLIGILFTEGHLVYNQKKDKKMLQIKEGQKPNKEIEAGRGLRITMLSIQDNDEGWFDTFTENINLEEPFKSYKITVKKNPTTDPKMRDFVHKFAINFLNFLHNPEVQYVEHIRSKKNMERRIRKRKPIIPNTNSIKISGVLKRYVDQMNERGEMHYSYRFWVRGHFRTYKSTKYKEMRGKKQWILPFVKGKGILVEKKYKLG